MTARICFVVSSPMTLQAFLAPHVAALQDRYALTLVANFSEGEPQTAERGVDVVSLPIERRIAPWRDLAALLHLVRLFRRSRFTVVQSVTPKAGLLAMLAGRLTGVPVRVHIFTGQVWATRRGAMRWLLKSVDRVTAACATQVLVDSPSQRDFLVAERVVAAGRSRVLGKGSVSGVDASRFRPDPEGRTRLRAQLGFPQDSVVFIFVGRLTRDKGVLDLAAAFARLTATGDKLRLLVVGPDEEGMQEAMQSVLGPAAAKVAFVGHTDRPEQYLAAADVFCLPSYREGFGTTIIEAGACGVPAIGSRIYGITDAIEDGASGLLFDAGNVAELAEHMSRFARDPALRSAAGERARAKALRDFSTSAITGELLRLYAAAIG